MPLRGVGLTGWRLDIKQKSSLMDGHESGQIKFLLSTEKHPLGIIYTFL